MLRGKRGAEKRREGTAAAALVGKGGRWGEETISRWAEVWHLLGRFFRKSVLNLCPECSQTCAGVIVTVVVLVTDFSPILGVEAQHNGAQTVRHSHRSDHEVTLES